MEEIDQAKYQGKIYKKDWEDRQNKIKNNKWEKEKIPRTLQRRYSQGDQNQATCET